MKNKITLLNKHDALDQVQSFKASNYFIVNLDGNLIKTKDEFFNSIEKSLMFPGKCEGLFSRFDDWITDLGWIENEKGICIIISAYPQFLSDDEEFKTTLLEDFEEEILPFWENDVKEIVKDGKPRSFFVILTE